MAFSPRGLLPQHSHASTSSVFIDASAEVDLKDTGLKDFNSQELAKVDSNSQALASGSVGVRASP
eukprot:9055557-Karenia_brevis.AAC.1